MTLKYTYFCTIPPYVDIMKLLRNLQLRRDPDAIDGYVDSGNPEADDELQPEL